MPIVEDRCPQCSAVRMVPSTRTGSLCKSCSCRNKAAARIKPLRLWKTSCPNCGFTKEVRATKDPGPKYCTKCACASANRVSSIARWPEVRCSVEGCGVLQKAKGLCAAHYQAEQRKHKEDRQRDKVKQLQERHSLAYMAGIVDGEGSITILRSTQKNPRTGKIYNCQVPIICVANTSKDLMEWIKDKFGGHYWKVKRARDENPRWKPTYEWACSCRQAACVAKMILPFLVIKKQQANLVLEFYRTRSVAGSPRTKTEEASDYRDLIIEQVHALNARGVHPVDWSIIEVR